MPVKPLRETIILGGALAFGIGYGLLGPLLGPADMLPKMAALFRAIGAPIPVVIGIASVASVVCVYLIARTVSDSRSTIQLLIIKAFVHYVLGLAIGLGLMILLAWLKIVKPPQAYAWCGMFAAINFVAAAVGLKAMKSRPDK
ncbi:MAG: hypothetical protein WD669_06875 [Pirellulales bacterium]